MRSFPEQCPHCRSRELYTRQVKSSKGPHGPALLKGLGSFFTYYPKFDVVLCSDCGHCDFFAEERACKDVASAKSWRRLDDAG